MSRRSKYWAKKVAKAGSVEKVIPRAAKGEGTWLTEVDIPGKDFKVSRGTGQGRVCTQPVSTRKEALIRKWAK